MRLSGFLAVLVAFWPVMVWDFMLVAGVVHRDWWSAVPSMGVAAAFAIAGFATLFAVLIGLMTGFLRAMSGNSN